MTPQPSSWKASRRQFLCRAAALGAAAAVSPRLRSDTTPGANAIAEVSSPGLSAPTAIAGDDLVSRIIADVAAGNASAVQQALERHPLLRTLSDARGRNLLWIAAESGHPDLFALVRIESEHDDIFDCAVAGDVKGIHALYEKDPAILNQVNRHGWTPLTAACRCGAAASVEALIGIGADPNYVLPSGETPLMVTLQYPDRSRMEWMIAVLLANGADPNAAMPDGTTPLHLALRRDSAFAASLLRRKGANVDRADSSGTTLRALAAASRQSEIAALANGPAALPRDNQEPAARFQLKNHTVADVRTPTGLPMVSVNRFVTVAHFDLQETQRLLRLCPDLLLSRAVWDELAVEGPTHLGNERATLYLLEQGSPYSLCTAAMLGDLAEVKRLLAVDQRAAHAKGPHDFAVIWYAAFGKPKPDIAELLLDAGADINSNVRGRSVLHEAAARDHAELIELLIQRGAEVNQRSLSTFQPGTPLAVALRRQRTRAADVLRRHGAVE